MHNINTQLLTYFTELRQNAPTDLHVIPSSRDGCSGSVVYLIMLKIQISFNKHLLWGEGKELPSPPAPSHAAACCRAGWRTCNIILVIGQLGAE